MKNQTQSEPSQENERSFWSTLPGVITAVTGLIVAITGLVTALGENGILNKSQTTPTPFPTPTRVDTDATLPAPIAKTPEPTDIIASAPTCRNFIEYKGKSNPNSILLAYSDREFWVRYADLEEDVEEMPGLKIYIFDPNGIGGDCLRRWVKFLVIDHTAHWPISTAGKGRTYNEIWMNSPYPPIVGELATWNVLPDTLLITAVDASGNPSYAQIFMCGIDISRELLSNVGYWHAATSEKAFQGYLDQYEANGYEIRPTIMCSG